MNERVKKIAVLAREYEGVEDADVEDLIGEQLRQNPDAGDGEIARMVAMLLVQS